MSISKPITTTTSSGPTPTEPIDDWYFLISPGIKLSVPQRENLFELEYRADIYKYVDTGNANDVVDHYLRGAAAFNFPGGMSIKAEDLANKSHESRGTENTVEVGSNLSRYYSNLANAEIAYAFADRYKIAVGYQNYIIDYNLSDQKYRDQFDNAATLTLFYQLMPKTSALLEGSYKRVVHDNDNVDAASGQTPGLNRLFNSNEYWARAGLTWDITAKSKGTIKGGYEWKIFDNPESKSFRSPIFEVDIDHNFTAKTAIKLSGLRQAFETDEVGASYYTDTTGSIVLSYKPLTKIEIAPRGSFSHDDYSQPIIIDGHKRHQDGQRMERRHRPDVQHEQMDLGRPRLHPFKQGLRFHRLRLYRQPRNGKDKGHDLVYSGI